jgi:hypothetical protein
MEFKKRLPAPFVEFVYKPPTRWIGQGFEDRVKVHLFR